MNEQIDVVVVAYQSRELLPSCLEAAAAIPGVNRIVVVDHGDDGSGDVGRELGAEVLADPSNPGFGAGQNRGVAQGTAPFVLLLNPDALVAPQAVAEGVRFLGDPHVAAVQGEVVGAGGTLERSQGRALGPLHLIGRALHLRHLLASPLVRRSVARLPIVADSANRSLNEPAMVASLAATAVLVRRSSFEAVGGFDERYFLYGEDLDLCRRLRNAGFCLLGLPGPWARHQNGASSASGWSREVSWWSGTLTYAAAWWSAPSRAAAAIPSLLVWAQLVGTRPRSWRVASAAILWRPWVAGRRIRRRPADRGLGPLGGDHDGLRSGHPAAAQGHHRSALRS